MGDYGSSNPLEEFIVNEGLLGLSDAEATKVGEYYSVALGKIEDVIHEDGISEMYQYTPSNSLSLLLPDIFLASGVLLTLMMCFFCAWIQRLVARTNKRLSCND